MNKTDNVEIAESNNDKELLSQKKQYFLSSSTSFQFVIFIVPMFFIYAPLFFIQFGRLTDYSIITTVKRSLLGYSEADHLLNLGRPLGAVLVSIQSMFFNSVESLAVGRFISFGLTMITAYLIFKYFVKKKLLEPLWALLAVFFLFTLPSIQLAMSWVTQTPPCTLTVLLSTISYILFDKATPLNPNYSDFKLSLKKDSTKSKLGIIGLFIHDNKTNIFFLFLSFIALSAACYIYPANAMFFLIFPLSNILFSPYKDWKKIRVTVLRDIIYLTAVVTFYFLSIKIVHLISVEIYNEANTLYDFSIGLFSVSIAERVAYTTRVLLQTLDGFQLILLSNLGLPLSATGEPSVVTPKVLFFALFIAGCSSKLFSYFRTSQRGEIGKNTFWIFAQMTVAVLFIILLAISPLTVPKLSALYPPALRNTIPISAIWVLIAFWSILSINRLLIKDKVTWILPVALAVIVGASTTKNLISSTLNAHMELSYIRQMLSSRDLSKIDRVILLGLELEWSQAYTRLAKSSTALTGDGLHSEFYLLGANNSMQPMIVIALQEIGYAGKHIATYNLMQRHWDIDEDPTEYPKYIRISEKLWDKSNRPSDDESTLIINMNHARLQKYKPKPPPPHENFVIHLPASSFTPDITYGGKAISGGDYSTSYTPNFAFDDDEDKTAWATRQQGKDIMGNAFVGYDFGSGVKRNIRRMKIKQFGAMMASVKVQSSDDGETWSSVTRFKLDNRSTDKGSYDLPPSNPARFWRILANSDVSAHPTGNWLVHEIEMMELMNDTPSG